ncbi:MAG TPA: hypothetical protein VKZ68_09370, partial [Ohtaekwangia sp.]|nr:hypothetical protein [Ohtaekwangia sp.]
MSAIKTIPLFAFVLVATLGSAQERIREGGFTFSGLNNFGLTYRVGKPEALWRFNAMSIDAARRDIDFPDHNETETNSGLQFSIGREFRKNLAEKLQFRYGFDASLSYSRQKTKA